MSTELKSLWFRAIEKANSKEISRLIYSSPNLEIGKTRLCWEIPNFETKLNLDENLHAFFITKMGSDLTGMNSLHYALAIEILSSNKPLKLKEVISILISVSFLFT